jgi:transcriptional regulator with XRE-family HTH domain
MNLGNAIKKLRLQKGIKQNALAALSGITQTYLSQIENNVKEPNLSTLKTICETLKTPLPIVFFLSIDDSDISPEKRTAFKHLSPSINSMLSEFFNETASLND